VDAGVLVVEQDRTMRDIIDAHLRRNGLDARHAGSAVEAMQALRRGRYGIVILDIDLPRGDGYRLLRDLRRESDVPVIMISVRDGQEDLVLSLAAGADDFVAKPFSARVLVARVRAHLRRAAAQRSRPRFICFGPYRLDCAGHILEKSGTRVALPAKEYEVLRLLCSRAGEALRPCEIYDQVWGQSYGDIATVSVHIRRLRIRLEEDAARPRYIETIRGAGYRFNPEVLATDDTEFADS
jgi:two-component system, OmpR family, response regulator RegX3